MKMLNVTPSQTDLAAIIRQRRTVNDFQSDLPPIEIILKGVELARWAPNHKLTEPWRFHVLGVETSRAIIELNCRLTAEAKGTEAAAKKREKWSRIPGWLVVTCLRSDDPLRDEENYAAVCCAIQNLLLFLCSEGIGTKWSTGDVTRHAEFSRLLNIDPTSERVVGMIWYGYPANVPASARRTVEEITVIHP